MIARIWHGRTTRENAELLRFETLDAVEIFAGKDYEQPVIPPDARRLLKRHSEKSRHYRIAQIN
jgi:hypothetical protein